MNRRLWLALISLACLPPTVAEDLPYDSVYTIDTDPLSVVSRAPGFPEGSLFAGFENNESVSLYNGNLVVAHPSTPTFPIDGGMSIGLTRTYNSKNARHEKIVAFDHGGGPSSEEHHALPYGRSWIGSGWTMHLGRIFPRSYYTTGDYGEVDWIFEDSRGTQVQFLPNQPSVEPRLKIQHFNDPAETEVCPSVEPICTSLCCDGEHPDGQPLTPGEQQLCDERVADGCLCNCPTDYYTVEYPDGTRLILREVVVWDPYLRNFIQNSDRAGYYTTDIWDRHGNHVEISYYSSDHNSNYYNPSYPEAIREVRIFDQGDPTGRLVIWTTLWDGSSPNGEDPELVAARAGTLKTLHYAGPNGAVSQQYLYGMTEVNRPPGVSYTTNGHQRDTETIPTLLRVDLPQIDGVPAGSIEYRYRSYASANDTTSRLLEEIEYPNGGVSHYEYGAYIAGSREADCPVNIAIFKQECGPSGDPQSTWQYRAERGVVERTLYPDGLGGPSYNWTWDRRFSEDDDNGLINRFVQINPDGTRTESKFGGNPEGHVLGASYYADSSAGPDGYEVERVTFAGDGVTPLRSEFTTYNLKVEPRPNWPYRKHYAGIKQREKEVLYHDDTQTAQNPASVCFADQYVEDGSGDRKIVTSNYQRDVNSHWRLAKVDGYYIDEPLINYVAYTDVPPGCDPEAHVPNTFTYKSVQQGDRRADVRYVFNCDGQVDNVRASDEIVTLASGCMESSAGDLDTWNFCLPAGSETHEIEHQLGYYPNGNLFTVEYSGGHPTGNTYHVTYTWDDGQATSIEYQGLSYPSLEVGVHPSGVVVSSSTPNDLETSFSYDELRRLTAISPPLPERPSRAAYPSLDPKQACCEVI